MMLDLKVSLTEQHDEAIAKGDNPHLTDEK